MQNIADKFRTYMQLNGVVNPIDVLKQLGFKIVHKELQPFTTFEIASSKASNIYAKQNLTHFDYAHFIGHLILHIDDQPFIDGSALLYKGKDFRHDEFEANQFALCFLMPPKVFIQVMQQCSTNDYIDIRAMAETFGCTKDYIMERGRTLKAHMAFFQ